MTEPATPPRLGRRRPRPPRSLKQHIIRRLIVVVPAFLLMFLFVRTGVLDNLYDQFTFSKLSWFDNTALVEHLRTIITRKGLTTMPRRCLVMVVNGDGSVNTPTIDVLGRHGNGCPGDKPSAELLFHVRVDRAGQSILTDASSPDMYHPLTP
ncbi:hypothetical protein [Bombella mellum]|uniref:hypothetical protein n=1 Tax=Bombella mellum TaxID=2039288 RepID=UPI0018A2BCD2|nr:hypothetical protein [Bombella mellum]